MPMTTPTKAPMRTTNATMNGITPTFNTLLWNVCPHLVAAAVASAGHRARALSPQRRRRCEWCRDPEWFSASRRTEGKTSDEKPQVPRQNLPRYRGCLQVHAERHAWRVVQRTRGATHPCLEARSTRILYLSRRVLARAEFRLDLSVHSARLVGAPRLRQGTFEPLLHATVV